jgi:transcriptional regulator with XRE-family HTH domain
VTLGKSLVSLVIQVPSMSNDATGIGSPANQAMNPGELADTNGCTSLQDTAVRLKLIRDAFGFSQRELAKRAGVTNSSISMIEQGQVSPSIQSLTRILAAFPISLADFFGFERPLSPHTALVGVVDSQSLLALPLRQLDIRIEHLLAGQNTAFIVPAVDSCGLVLEGEIQLTLLSGNQLLVKGDSFYISAGQPFRLIKLSGLEASLFRCSLFVR